MIIDKIGIKLSQFSNLKIQGRLYQKREQKSIEQHICVRKVS